MNRRGLSLIEIIVVSAIVLGALTLVGTLMNFGARLSRNGEERNLLQNSRLKASQLIRRAQSNSYRSGNTSFYLTPSPDLDDLALSFISPESWDDVTQRAVFGGYTIFYRSTADNTLRFLEAPIPPTSVALPLTEAQVRGLITADPGTVLMEDVTSFQLYLPDNGTVVETLTNPMGLRLTQTTSRGTPLHTELTHKFVSP